MVQKLPGPVEFLHTIVVMIRDQDLVRFSYGDPDRRKMKLARFRSLSSPSQYKTNCWKFGFRGQPLGTVFVTFPAYAGPCLPAVCDFCRCRRQTKPAADGAWTPGQFSGP